MTSQTRQHCRMHWGAQHWQAKFAPLNLSRLAHLRRTAVNGKETLLATVPQGLCQTQDAFCWTVRCISTHSTTQIIQPELQHWWGPKHCAAPNIKPHKKWSRPTVGFLSQNNVALAETVHLLLSCKRLWRKRDAFSRPPPCSFHLLSSQRILTITSVSSHWTMWWKN